jgi:hypothetical protein
MLAGAMPPKRLLAALAVLIVLVLVGSARADHLRPHPFVTAKVKSCAGGTCAVEVSWDVNCPGGERFEWQVALVDAARPFDPSIFGDSVPVKYYYYVSGDGFAQVSGGQETVRIEAAKRLYPAIEAGCSLADTTHESQKFYAVGDKFETPPALEPPHVTDLGGGGGGGSGGSGPTDPNHVPPHHRISLRMVFAGIAYPNDVLAVNLHGAGVNIIERARASRLAHGQRRIVFRTRRRGTIRCFVRLLRYGVDSNVVKLRVR